MAGERNLGTKTGEFLHMHETVLENRLRNVRDALRARHQRHELRLQVGREAGEGLGDDVDRLDAIAISHDPKAGFRLADRRACQTEGIERVVQQRCPRSFQHHVTPGHRDRHGVGARFDAVWQNTVARAGKRGDTFDGDGGGAGAFDLRAHRDEAVGEIDDLGLAGGVVDDGGAAGKACRHQHHMRCANGNLREGKDGTDQATLGRGGVDITAIDLHRRAERLQSLDEQIHRSRADGAAAGQRNAGAAFARQQRADDPEACAHLGDQLIGSCRIDNGAAGEMYGAGIGFALAFAAAVNRDIDAVITENADELLHVRQMRDVFERQRIACQKRCDHQRQGRVLGAGDGNDAVERIATRNSDAIHASLRAFARLSYPALWKGVSIDQFPRRFNLCWLNCL
ncbi:SDR family oxidoreductase [Agrobacterium tumefaciens]|nr:SDR family oxidoreductase [Agrobacterium tumefaciens]